MYFCVTQKWKCDLQYYPTRSQHHKLQIFELCIHSLVFVIYFVCFACWLIDHRDFSASSGTLHNLLLNFTPLSNSPILVFLPWVFEYKRQGEGESKVRGRADRHHLAEIICVEAEMAFMMCLKYAHVMVIRCSKLSLKEIFLFCCYYKQY